MSTVRIGVIGAAGRMGRRIICLATEHKDCTVNGAAEYLESPFVGMDALEVAGAGKSDVTIKASILDAAKDVDVFIDFTGAEPTLANLDTFREAGVPLVIGSTGFNPEQVAKIRELSLSIPVLLSPNMSMGVNLTFKVLEMVAKTIGNKYDMEIVESHHRLKKDSPSGTAMKMAEVIAEATGRDLEKDAVYERKGLVGERTDNEIGIQTIRGGDIVGEHTVYFIGNGERIEITHRAHTRDTFASGAVEAGIWLAGKPAGMYNMYDVLGL